jgi:hypothetical protein
MRQAPAWDDRSWSRLAETRKPIATDARQGDRAMNQFDLAATALTARADAPIDFISLAGQPIGTVTLQPQLEARPASQLDEPQSLTLALIGAATLLTYRGIKQRLATVANPSQPAVAGRRRAA